MSGDISSFTHFMTFMLKPVIAEGKDGGSRKKCGTGIPEYIRRKVDGTIQGAMKAGMKAYPVDIF